MFLASQDVLESRKHLGAELHGQKRKKMKKRDAGVKRQYCVVEKQNQPAVGIVCSTGTDLLYQGGNLDDV